MYNTIHKNLPHILVYPPMHKHIQVYNNDCLTFSAKSTAIAIGPFTFVESSIVVRLVPYCIEARSTFPVNIYYTRLINSDCYLTFDVDVKLSILININW